MELSEKRRRAINERIRAARRSLYFIQDDTAALSEEAIVYALNGALGHTEDALNIVSEADFDSDSD